MDARTVIPPTAANSSVSRRQPMTWVAVKNIDENLQIFLKVKPSDTFKNLKEMFEKERRIACDLQRFFTLDGNPIDDDHIIGVGKGNRLEIELRIPGELLVNIKTFYGKVFSLVINETDIVDDVKKKIARFESIPLCILRLEYNGSELVNKRAISSYDVKHRDTFEVLKRTSECACGPRHREINSITVRTGYKKTFTVDVASSDTIKKIKEKLQELVEIPADKQILSHRGDLDDKRIMGEIALERPLYLSRVGDMQLFVKTLKGKCVTLEVNESDMVDVIRAQIAEREGYPLRDIHLIFCGRQLEDGESLSHYRIKKEATIHMVIRLA